MNSKIEVRNIRSLSGMNFFIPDYQRGYRWSSKQVERMLDDFKEFCDRKSKEETSLGEFYCLQPIVVKPKMWNDPKTGSDVDGYEVIDGQQRLTTLFIILKYLDEAGVRMRHFSRYSIKYETRLEYDSQAFLENITNPQQNANDYIDFFYMKEVYDAVHGWFASLGDYSEDYEDEISKVLLEEKILGDNPQDIANNVRVIWYEVEDTENTKETSVNIFTRLNIGKIPLTNAELIKALLLRKGNFNQNEEWLRQVQISTEWNLIEQTLQDDDFWYFIHTADDDYENRIEYIFDLMKHRTKDSEFYHTFIAFGKQLEDLKANKDFPTEQLRVEKVWNDIKNYFQMFKEWYDDRILYHFIGFLIENGEDIDKLMKASHEMDKDEFLVFIHQEIKSMLAGVDLDRLSYGEGSGSQRLIRRVLLLFNILTVQLSEKSDMRFPFSKFKREKWDIEHISAQTDKETRLVDNEKRLSWLRDELDYFVGDSSNEAVETYIDNLEANLKKRSKELREDATKQVQYEEQSQELELVKSLYELYTSDKINEGKFEEVFNTSKKMFESERLDDPNLISNLTLLDAETNRGYGNAFFPVKRKWIIRNDKQGVFVPIVTKNVFLKFYSPRVSQMMRWEKEDAECYLEAMKQMLNEYLSDSDDE